MADSPDAPLTCQLADYPLFALRLFAYPRSLVRGYDFEDGALLRRLALYALISLAILVLAFGNNRPLADKEHVRLSSYKGVVMRAHDASWDLMEPVYSVFNVSQREAKRLWDTLLTTGFLCYTFFASLIALAVVVRLRMAWHGLSWNHAIGTGLLGYLALCACMALALVPFTELLICRHCFVRAMLCCLLGGTGLAYLGYYTLGDFGERSRSCWIQLLRSLGYGALQYACAYLIFIVLIAAIIPL